jgi:hypothetical protein
MDTKYKVIITVFIVLAMLYALQYILTYVSSEKSKDKLREHFEASNTNEQENVKIAPEHDVYMDILNVIDDYMAKNTDVSAEVKASIYTKLGEDDFADKVKGKSPDVLKDTVTKEIESIMAKSKKTAEPTKQTAPAEKFVDGKEDDESTKLQEMSSRLDTIVKEIQTMKVDIDAIRTKASKPAEVAKAEPVAPSSGPSTTPASPPPKAAAVVAEKKEIRETFVNYDSLQGFENVRSFAMFS